MILFNIVSVFQCVLLTRDKLYRKHYQLLCLLIKLSPPVRKAVRWDLLDTR